MHVGYWLVDDGLEALEQALGYRLMRRQRASRWAFRHAAILYATALVVATAATMFVPAWYLTTLGTTPAATLLALVVVLLPASTLAVTAVLWLVTVVAPPRILLKLDFEAAIPDECKAAVVIPTLVGSPREAGQQLERLELHYLANPDPTTQFVLLSDFCDSAREHEPSDEAILAALVAEVHRLNQKYASKPFHVLHRPRRFNAAEGVWMAWERKRGKLEELNRLLTGDPMAGFSLHEGERSQINGISYVVTVDLDTLLPKGTLARLIGTLAHPLNRAEFDEAGRVRTGYTVLQPRVEISPEYGSRSRFARWFTGDTTIDIYSRAVSDVYQDLFGSGIYVGKGVYDVAGFRRSLDGRVPENALASHDLFEGIHGRAALATDIVLYETFPRQYLEFTRRQHRWIRGDWQLLPWLWRTVPGVGGRRLRNRLRGIDRWKIVDNLRRSLLPPALVTMLLAGWLVLPGHPAVWTLLGVLAPGGHIFTDLVTGLARGRRRSVLASTMQRLSDHTGRWSLLLVFLPHDAAVAADAIARTLMRVLLTHRHLLQWTSAAHTSEQLANGSGRPFMWRQMWIAPALAILTLGAILVFRPQALAAAAPLLAAWFVAPEVAYVLGQPQRRPSRQLDADDRTLLRRIARRTWRYFEVFAGPEDQWLPPDNFQEQPRGTVAHRTSPTNIGMMFLSTLAACDLGYVGLDELAARLRNSLATLTRLERYRGHLFNWYDTRTVEPLTPRYVSTVDSGNLAMSLLALKEGCLELADGPALPPQQWSGLSDILKLLDDALAHFDVSTEKAASLRECLDAIEVQLVNVGRDPNRWVSTLRNLLDRDVPALDRHVVAAVTEREAHTALPRVREVRIWLERLHHHLRNMDREYRSLFPWLMVLTPPPALAGTAAAIAAAAPATLALGEVADQCRRARYLVPQSVPAPPSAEDPALLEWTAALDAALEHGEQAATALRASLLEIASQAEQLALAMDFGLLYDKDLRLFHIGYNVTADRVDPHHYDLLASEARLASLFAIAKGDVPVEHWFHLGRPTTVIARERCLLSWGGSMFEYLMPALLLRSEEGSLLAESERVAVEAQRRYGQSLDIPWGMSESGLSATDADQTYQYRSFGVPALGFRRGLGGEAVVAPYASALALPTDLAAALENVRRLEELGLVGEYGFYEAADFTADRLPSGHVFVPVLSYMAHHQGMVLAAIDNALNDGALVRRTERDRRLRSVALLLHERVPVDVAPEAATAAVAQPRRTSVRPIPRIEPWLPMKAGAFPEMHVLGNGRLATWISDSGAGTLRWQDWNLTRWVADATTDDTGVWTYVHDEESGAVWSAARQPCGAAPDAVDVVFYPHLAEFHRRDGDLAVRVEVVVAPADDIEVRRVTVINDGDQIRRLTITTCAEVALAKAQDHERHPAFSKLFVRSEFVRELDGLVFVRQPRRPDERAPVLLHRVVSDDTSVRLQGFETDRAAFLGRGRTYRDPAAAVRSTQASSSGFTLDPILALRVEAAVEPGASVQFAFVTAVAGSRESALDLAERYQTMNAVDWVMAEAETEAGRELQRFGIEPARMAEIQTLASLLIYRHRALRCAAETIAGNHLGQPGLWGLGLSGDLPILLLKLRLADDVDVSRDIARMHALWRRRGLRFDLVALRYGAPGYEELVGEKLRALLHDIGTRELLGQHGGIHVLSADHIGEDDRRLLDVAANVVLDAARGPLASQLTHAHEEMPVLPRFLPGRSLEEEGEEALALTRPAELLFDNGVGGFTTGGREYVIYLEASETTPAPWCNVLSNPEFGTLVTETGGGFTWAANSGEHRLTPWTNDPVSDPPREALYVRDEETGAVWTPTPQPAGAPSAHEVRYGAGYAHWRSASHGLSQDLLVFVPPDDPVKVIRLHVRNHRHRPRRLTVSYYAEWMLGGSRVSSNATLVTEYAADCQAMLAWNPWQVEFAKRVAFVTADRKPHGLTSDRTEFIGREGSLRRPAALERWGLSSTVQPGRDPCAAFQIHLDVPADAEDDVVFVLGEGRTREHALELIARWHEVGTADAAWERLGRFWDERLGAVRVDTPDGAANIMLNRWLLY
ncbi:MAG: cellobiose phosphorylase, partial [Acidobacteria bacterium]